jgi:hypothetical protein
VLQRLLAALLLLLLLRFCCEDRIGGCIARASALG